MCVLVGVCSLCLLRICVSWWVMVLFVLMIVRCLLIRL